jgi:4,5-dihydroxyphthalate decarboxylase
VRGALQHDYGVDLEKIRWFSWSKSRMEIDMARRYDVTQLPPGSAPDEMLAAGELDAMICANLFPSMLNGRPEIRRLFEDYPDVEAAYFKKTGIFPIMHTVAMREELWKDSPEIAVDLFNAFQHAKREAYDHLNDLSPYKISLVWFREPLKLQREILGDDPWPYGLAKNRHVVETLMGYLYEQGLARRTLAAEELFASNTLGLQ